MLSSDEIRIGKGQIQFSLADSRAVRAQMPVTSGTKEVGFPRQAAPAERRVNLSGSQVLLGFVFALGFIGLFVWALKFWLFEE